MDGRRAHICGDGAEGRAVAAGAGDPDTAYGGFEGGGDGCGGVRGHTQPVDTPTCLHLVTTNTYARVCVNTHAALHGSNRSDCLYRHIVSWVPMFLFFLFYCGCDLQLYKLCSVVRHGKCVSRRVGGYSNCLCNCLISAQSDILLLTLPILIDWTRLERSV
jgi:hypothetical protein